VSWWRAENSGLDSAGSNHGLVTNGASYAAGQTGLAFALDGVNDFVQVADSPSLRPASVTLETWVFFTAAGTRVLLGKPVGSGTSDSYQIFLSGGTLGGFVGDAAGAGTVLSIPFSPTLVAGITWPTRLTTLRGNKCCISTALRWRADWATTHWL